MATEDRLRVLSEDEFRDASLTLGRKLSASTLDRFFYAAAGLLEDSFNEPSAGASLRGVSEDILERLNLVEERPLPKEEGELQKLMETQWKKERSP